MDQLLKRAYLVQVSQSVDQGMLAAELINQGLVGRSELAWLGISSLLTASANVSKIVWPAQGSTRTAIRDHLGLDDESALRDRRLRNHFEHLDERVQTWWDQSPDHNIVDTYIGPRSAISGIDFAGNWFRTFDPQTCRATFNDEEFDLQALVDELSRIQPRCAAPWFGEEPRLGGPAT